MWQMCSQVVTACDWRCVVSVVDGIRICGVAMRCVWHQGDVAMLSIRLWLPSV